MIAAAGEDDVELREEFDPSLPEVLGNEDGLVQVLINLLSNARDACRDAREPADRDPHALRRPGLVLTAIRLGRPVKLPIEVRVSDNGPGVPPELRDHIFEPFVTSKKNGQGLGLALVNKLVRDMDGRISHERDDSGRVDPFQGPPAGGALGRNDGWAGALCWSRMTVRSCSSPPRPLEDDGFTVDSCDLDRRARPAAGREPLRRDADRHHAHRR